MRSSSKKSFRLTAGIVIAVTLQAAVARNPLSECAADTDCSDANSYCNNGNCNVCGYNAGLPCCPVGGKFSAACGAGLTCSSGTCGTSSGGSATPPPPPPTTSTGPVQGGQCSKDSDCSDVNSFCNNGNCNVCGYTNGLPCCPVGDKFSQPCGSGLSCNAGACGTSSGGSTPVPTTTGGTPAPTSSGTKGGQCSKDTDCSDANSYCNNGNCNVCGYNTDLPCCPVGDKFKSACGSGLSCIAGSCSSGGSAPPPTQFPSGGCTDYSGKTYSAGQTTLSMGFPSTTCLCGSDGLWMCGGDANPNLCVDNERAVLIDHFGGYIKSVEGVDYLCYCRNPGGAMSCSAITCASELQDPINALFSCDGPLKPLSYGGVRFCGSLASSSCGTRMTLGYCCQKVREKMADGPGCGGYRRACCDGGKCNAGLACGGGHCVSCGYRYNICCSNAGESACHYNTDTCRNGQCVDSN